MNDQQQQPDAVPFNEVLEATDKAAGLPDGQFLLQLVRVEKFVGTKWGTENTPQDKIRFVLLVLSGPEQGNELWKIENLPPARDGKRIINKMSGAHKTIGMLRGRPLVDGENVPPASLIGTQGIGVVADSKLSTFIPQMAAPPQQTQDAQGNGQPLQQQPPQPAAYSQPLTQQDVQQQQAVFQDTQQQAVERFE